MKAARKSRIVHLSVWMALRILSSLAAIVLAESDSEAKSVVRLSMLLSISCHSSSIVFLYVVLFDRRSLEWKR